MTTETHPKTLLHRNHSHCPVHVCTIDDYAQRDPKDGHFTDKVINRAAEVIAHNRSSRCSSAVDKLRGPGTHRAGGSAVWRQIKLQLEASMDDLDGGHRHTNLPLSQGSCSLNRKRPQSLIMLRLFSFIHAPQK